MTISRSSSDLAQSMPSALRQRVLTGLIMALVTTGAVLLLPSAGLGVAMLPVIGLAAWELGPLVGLTGTTGRAGYVVALLGLIALVWALVPVPWYLVLLVPIVAFWLVAVPFVLRAGPVLDASGVDRALLLVSFPVMAAPWFAILALHQNASAGPWLVLFLMMLVWLADSAAYFAGRRFGRNKLAPHLSPGKTIEGVLGALFAAVLWSLVLLPIAPGVSWAWLALLSVVTAMISVVGDLVESWLKRRRHLKDTGSLLPGHGGMLDRLDSMVSASPVFAIGFLLWEKTL